jgi:hypothetical protein
MAYPSSLEHLRNHLWTSLGLALPAVVLACSDRQMAGDEVADDDTETVDDSEDGSSSDSSSGNSTTATSTSTSTSETGEPDGCSITFHSEGVLEFPDCTLPVEDEFRCPTEFYLACAPALDETCESQCPNDGVCEECTDQPLVNAGIGSCGPYLIDGQCCAIIGLATDCWSDEGEVEGRPFVVEGTLRLPAIELDPEPSDLLRRHLAEHWARVAAAEHASVASFAQFALHLLALGVPPELIRDAFAAAGDEVRHAEAALAIASRHAGRSLRFGPLDVRGAAQHPEDLESLVTACVREGCIGETLAALELATAADCCDDPQLAALLRSISNDEARHAALAWRFVQWALARDPGLRPKVASLFASWQPSSSPPSSLDRATRDQLRRHGCLDPATRRRVEHEGLRQLLRPCANALLASASEARA